MRLWDTASGRETAWLVDDGSSAMLREGGRRIALFGEAWRRLGLVERSDGGIIRHPIETLNDLAVA